MTITPAAAARATRDFSDAGMRFARSRDYLRDSRPLQVAALLPPVGDQVHAAEQLSDIGDRLSRTGTLGLEVASVALSQQHPGAATKTAVSERALALLTAVAARIKKVQAELAAVRRDRAAIPSSGLLPQLQSAVHTLDGKLGEVSQTVDTLVRLEPGIAELLGANGPRTYLVLQQDPAELRATGGFIGSVGFLAFDHGRMAPYRAVDIYTIDHGTVRLGDPGYVAPPAPIDSRIHPSSWELRDANWSPDFPATAREAAALYQKETGAPVNGVIAIDPYLMSRLLQLVGPVTVPETGDVLTPQNFFALTLANVNKENGAGRKNFLGYAARPIFERLSSLSSSQWMSLLQTLLNSCQERSLQANFISPQAQSVVDNFACNGQAAAPGSDRLRVIDSNLGGNKDDFWLKRRFDLTIAPATNGSVEHRLTIHYDGSQLVPNARTGLYIDWIRVYLPAGSRVEEVGGAALSAAVENGRPLVAGWMQLNYGQSIDVVVRYRTSGPHAPGRITIDWQKQAGRSADPIAVHLQLPAGTRVLDARVNGRAVGHGGELQSDLAVDRALLFVYGRAS